MRTSVDFARGCLIDEGVETDIPALLGEVGVGWSAEQGGSFR